MDFPNEKWADYLSSNYDALKKISQTLDGINAALISGGVAMSGRILSSDTSNQNLTNPTPYAVLTIKMDNAGTDVPFPVTGNNLTAATDGTLAGVMVKFGDITNPAMPLYYFIGKNIPLNKIFLTWPSQTGTTLYIITGMKGIAEFALTQSDALAQQVGIYTRWGRLVTPVWVQAAEVVAPGAATALVTQAVSIAKTGYIYGFFITTGEANNFLLNWTSGGVANSKRIIFGSAGTIENVDPVAMNEGLGADAGSNVTITNVTAAGAGVIYQANILYGEI